MENMPTITLVKTYIGLAVYKGNVLATNETNSGVWPNNVLRAIGCEVESVDMCEFDFWKEHDWKPPENLLKLKELWAAHNRMRKEYRLAQAREEVAKLQQELQPWQEVACQLSTKE